MMRALMRSLQDQSFTLVKNLHISSFRPSGLRKTIEEIPDHHFLIGVVYEAGDSQICISGRVKEGESLEDGCVREMREEVFLRPKEGFIFDNPLIKGKNHFFTYHIKDLVLSPIKVDDNIGIDSRKRVFACIHGERDEIIKYMKEIKVQSYTNDKIIGIWASDKKSVIDYLNPSV